MPEFQQVGGERMVEGVAAYRIEYLRGLGQMSRALIYPCRTMNDVPFADFARVTAEDFRRAHPGVITSALANELAIAIELAVLSAVRTERHSCAAACTRRAELWETTAERPQTNEPARIEARHRSNEARYLSDLIASRP